MASVLPWCGMYLSIYLLFLFDLFSTTYIYIHVSLPILDIYPVLHYRIRLLYTFIILARHLKCRNVFPDGIPIMDNRAKGEEANKALEEARNDFRKNAKKINLVLDTVDPTGNNTN